MLNTFYLIKNKENKGYNSVKLADALNVSKATITYWEKGISYPRMDKLITLCKLLDMDANILLNLKGE